MANSFTWGASLGLMTVVGAGVLPPLAVGCGPSYDERTIKTANERLQEQEALAYEEEQRQHTNPTTGAPVEDTERPGEFDEKQAELEFKRATRSAETCPDVVTDEKSPRGKTAVTVTFALDGSVASATIPPPYEETRLGNCVLNAYQALIVPPYSGERKVITWDVDLGKADEKAAKKK